MTKTNTKTESTIQSDLDLELTKIQTTSGKIRYLTSLEWKRGDIAKKLEIRYQHVRNVQIQPLKRTDTK